MCTGLRLYYTHIPVHWAITNFDRKLTDSDNERLKKAAYHLKSVCKADFLQTLSCVYFVATATGDSSVSSF